MDEDWTMGTGRKFRSKPVTRPRKSESERDKRVRQQKARLVALGMDETEVAGLNVKQVREKLLRPAKIQAKA